MTLPALSQIMSIGALWTVAVVTPGPNFFAAARIASLRDRRAGLAVVAGIGVGTMLWGCAGAFGIRTMFEWAPRLYTALKLVGAAYLLFIGARIIAASFGAGPPPPARRGAGSAMRLGFLTSVSNPKSALFVASMFAAVMPRGAGWTDSSSAVAEMVAISVGWYGLVVSLLTTRAVSLAYARMRRGIDRAAGGIFMASGARLIWERG